MNIQLTKIEILSLVKIISFQLWFTIKETIICKKVEITGQDLKRKFAIKKLFIYRNGAKG